MNRAEIEALADKLSTHALDNDSRNAYTATLLRESAAALRFLLPLAYVEGEETWKDKAEDWKSMADALNRNVVKELELRNTLLDRLAAMTEALATVERFKDRLPPENMCCGQALHNALQILHRAALTEGE